MTELWKLGAGQLAAMIREKEVSSREVVQAHLDRIDVVNPSVNAVTVKLEESALAFADNADRNPALTPLHGVPFTIKENIDCVGSPTTNGIPAGAEAMPTVDSPVVTRMKAAGAVPLARTNLPEMGLRVSTVNPLRGRTMNPWSEKVVAGGSSGGEASALATGMTPIGLGNDIGGSVRNPAFCCGTTSLKPSVGRIPHALSIPPGDTNGLAGQLMAVEGPMARHVSDLRIAYQVLSGRDIRDPVSVDMPLVGPPVQKRAGLVRQVPNVALPDHHVAAIEAAGEALRADGWEIIDLEPPSLERVTEVWGHVLRQEFEPIIELMAMVMSPEAVKIIQDLCEKYPQSAMPSPALHSERWNLCVAWSQVFETCPVMIGPTWTCDPWEHDADIQDDATELVIDTLRFITPANLLALPAVALPMGVHNGLPTGVQLLADRWRDDVVLDAAAIIEAEVGQITPIDPRF